ncbi:MAG: arrestin family protein [Thermoplasmata archaeon]
MLGVLSVAGIFLIVLAFISPLGLVLGVPLLVVVGLLLVVVANIIWFRGRARARSLRLVFDRSLVFPGEEVEGHLELRPKRHRVLRSLTARAWGGEEVSVAVSRGEHTTTVREQAPVLDENIVLEPEGSAPWPSSGEGEVAVGPSLYRFRFSFKIPEGAPPTTWSKREYLRGFVRVEPQGVLVRYFLRVRADFRGSLDAVHEFEIPVGSQGTPSDARSSHAIPSSTKGGPGRPTVRLELDHQEVEAGSPLRGSLSVTRLQDKRIQGVRIRLVERKWGKAHGHETSKSKTLAKTELPSQGGLGGIMSPFTLQIPAGLRPSYVGQISSLRHIVRVRVRLGWARDLKVKEEIRVVSRLP